MSKFDEQFDELMREGISSAAVKRMDGLVNQKDYKKLMGLVDSIVDDLGFEGFEEDEVRDYLAAKLQDY
jgi:hypothetical protein